MSDTIHDAYLSGRRKLRHLDLIRCAGVLGLTTDGRIVEIPFYDQVFHVSPKQLVNAHGEQPTDAVGLVLCQYLLNCPADPLPKGRLLTFRELDGAGPLVASFANNTNKIITSAFSDALALETAGRQMKGITDADASGFDLVMAFYALPRIPLTLQFNGADDLFPAQCSLLFDQSAQSYLDMQSLFILGTYLAGGLVGAASCRENTAS